MVFPKFLLIFLGSLALCLPWIGWAATPLPAGPPTPSAPQLQEALAQLESDDFQTREAAINFLPARGDTSSTRPETALQPPDLTRLLPLLQADYRQNTKTTVRLELIHLLEKVHTPEGTTLLLQLYQREKDFLLEQAQAVTLARLYDIRSASSFPPTSKKIEAHLSQPKKDLLNRLTLQFRVEQYLDQQITQEGGYGTYRDQYTALAQWSPKVFTILEDIISNPDHAYLLPDVSLDHLTIYRVLATDALGYALQNPEIHQEKETLQGFVAFLKRFISFQLPLNEVDRYDLTDYAAISAYQLGEKTSIVLLEGVMGLREREALSQGDFPGYANLELRRANILTKLKLYPQAETIYLQMAHFVSDSTLYYNMACLYADQGEKKQALEAFKKSVDMGYDDVEWMEKDRELDPLRSLSGFKKIIADLKKKKAQNQ